MVLGRQKGRGMVDMHCHILPEVDDGSRNMEETMIMLKMAAASGIEAMIVTPHYKKGRHNADPDTVIECMDMVREAARRRNINIPLYPGNELFYFSGAEEALERGEILTLNHTDRILIEFSPCETFFYIRNALEGLRGIGCVPVIAHVERYECLLKDHTRMEELKQMDTEIQINASSIAGAAGYGIKKFVHRLLKEQMVDYVGTDAHDAKKRTPEAKKVIGQLYKKYDAGYVDAILYENALALLGA